MPHIRIRGLSESAVQKISQILPQTLAPAMETTEDNFSVERVTTVFYKDGRVTEGDPMVEVHWFGRGQGVQDRCAQLITTALQPLTKSEFIAVVFIDLPKENYYENGQHF